MKKCFSIFMIFLVLFNFYACTKNTFNPIKEGQEYTNINIIYLDKDDRISETPTDTVAMQLENDTTGFMMVCKKESVDNYKVYLLDNINNNTITMFYTNKKFFPCRIDMHDKNSDEYSIGMVTPYRVKNKNFDIRWYDENSDYYDFNDIHLNSNVFDHIRVQGVSEQTDYQIKIIKISVRILDAINSYSESIPQTRGWNGFVNFFKRILRPIVRVVSIIVSAFVPPLAPIMATITSVFEIVASSLKENDSKQKETDKKVHIPDENLGIYYDKILDNGETLKTYKKGGKVDIIYKNITSLNDNIKKITIEVVLMKDGEVVVNNTNFQFELDIATYFNFSINDKKIKLNSDLNIYSHSTLKKDQQFTLTIERRSEDIPSNIRDYDLNIKTTVEGNSPKINSTTKNTHIFVIE